MGKADADPRYERLSKVLKEARQAKKVTQVQLGAALGKDQVWVSKFEVGRRQIDVIEFLDIARAIGVDPCRLLRRIGD
ncbi:MAG: helix-turn-helix transcriptional regulator [Planctomycetia bacterium]|nr:helix-turn-helix transcriptional regulator [Planctomycetia bacterium]